MGNTKILEWSTEDKDYLIDNYKTLDKEILIETLKRTWKSIVIKACRLGIKRDYPEGREGSKLKGLDSNISLEYLLGNNTYEIAKKYNCSHVSISTILRENNIKTREFTETSRKYLINENYFDTIDNENKAYILGLLYADGNNYPELNTVQLSLIESDKLILDKITNLIQPDKPLKYVSKQYMRDKGVKASPQYNLIITNKHISKRLIELGLVKNKSLILTFPIKEQVPEHLYNHFIRGYFDGDGCIHVNKKNNHSFSMLGTKEFLEKVQNILVEKTGINFTKISRKKNIYCLSYTGIFNGLKIEDYM